MCAKTGAKTSPQPTLTGVDASERRPGELLAHRGGRLQLARQIDDGRSVSGALRWAIVLRLLLLLLLRRCRRR